MFFLTPLFVQAVLGVMQQRNVRVNVQTFGCLALGCERQKDGLQLLKDMEVMQNTCYTLPSVWGSTIKTLTYSIHCYCGSS